MWSEIDAIIAYISKSIFVQKALFIALCIASGWLLSSFITLLLFVEIHEFRDTVGSEYTVIAKISLRSFVIILLLTKLRSRSLSKASGVLYYETFILWNLTISNFRVILRVACLAKVRNSSLHMIVKQNYIIDLPSDSLSPPPSSWRKWVFFFRCWLAWFPPILLCFLIKFRSMAFRVFFGDVSV